MNIQAAVSIIFSIILAIVLLYMGIQSVTLGILGIRKKRIRLWTLGNSKKSYSVYTGQKATVKGVYSIVLGIGMILLGVCILSKLIYL